MSFWWCCCRCLPFFRDPFDVDGEPDSTYWDDAANAWEIVGGRLTIGGAADLTLKAAAYNRGTSDTYVVRVKVVSLDSSILAAAVVLVDGGRIKIEAHHSNTASPDYQGRLRILTDLDLSGTFDLVASVPLYWTGEEADALNLVIACGPNWTEAYAVGATSGVAAYCHANGRGVSPPDREVALTEATAANIVYDDFSVENGEDSGGWFAQCTSADRHCTVFSEPFDYEIELETSLDWEYDSDISLVGGAVQAPGGSVWMPCRLSLPNPCSISAMLNVGTVGVDSIYLLFEYTDSSNFKAFAIKQDSTGIVSCVGGVETWLDSQYGVSGSTAVKLCIAGPRVTATFGSNTLEWAGTNPIAPAIALRDGIGTVSWDDVQVSEYRAGCDCWEVFDCPDNCQDSLVPDAFQITVAGYPADYAIPAACDKVVANANGTFVLYPFATCLWRSDVFSAWPRLWRWYAQVINLGYGPIIGFYLWEDNTTSCSLTEYEFEAANGGNPIPCTTLSNESATNIGAPDGATLEVTSIT